MLRVFNPSISGNDPMLPKATWPPSPIEELDRTMNDTPSDDETRRKWVRGDFLPIRDDELDELVFKIEREEFAHV